ncbi:MAG: CpsB/CapC family capsule biosynthesis tyrosine phosphatase [Thermoleophilia bacterium]|nr:CpsB/CapC family capsule biosynthesis tyrosine phosphatase [Thermoleophilia bacterium]
MCSFYSIIERAGILKEGYRDVTLNFIDTHCHIIHGVDDGPASMETSIEMARLAMDDGITTVVATPHIVEGYYDGHDRSERLRQLGSRLSDASIFLELVAGAEVPMSACLTGDAGLLKPLALNGGIYLLMETADTTFEQLAQAVYQIRLCGLYPILAHPERTRFVQDNPSRLAEIVARGEVFCQLTAASLDGTFGKSLQKSSLVLARSGLMHLVASDAHSTGRRKPCLSGAYEILRKELGETAARMVTHENPRRVLESQELENAVRNSGADVSGRSVLARFMHRRR